MTLGAKYLEVAFTELLIVKTSPISETGPVMPIAHGSDAIELKVIFSQASSAGATEEFKKLRSFLPSPDALT